MTPRPSWKTWDQFESERLYAIVTDMKPTSGAQWRAISEMFAGRTPTACRQRFLYLKSKVDGTRPPGNYSGNTSAYKPKDSYKSFEERRALLNYQRPVDLPPPATITAAIFGDPIPGRSALDRKRAEEIRA